jgi:hypothetical protein
MEPLVLQGQLFQVASGTAAPLGQKFRLEPISPLASDSVTATTVSVPLPVVERETEVELRVHSFVQGNPRGCPAGRIPLRVYPEDLLADLRSWAELHSLRVKDAHGTLRKFLEQREISLDESYGIPRNGDVPPVTLYVGDDLPEQVRARAGEGEAVVAFTEREMEWPLLTVEHIGAGFLIRVEALLIERLASDPRAQEALVAIFETLERHRSFKEREI